MLIPSAAGFILGFIVGYESFGNHLLISPLIDLAIAIQMALILIVVFISIIFIIENIKPNKIDTMLEKNTQE